MRVAIVSDTHGAVDERVLELIATSEVCVHAGDIGAAAIIDDLERHCRLICVKGNNDVPNKWPGADRHRLDSIPNEARLKLPGGDLVVTHGHRHGPAKRRHQRLRADYADAQAVVYGHSHRLKCDTEQLPWILNPGAAGRARTYGGPSCILLMAHEDSWQLQVRRFAKQSVTSQRGGRQP